MTRRLVASLSVLLAALLAWAGLERPQSIDYRQLRERSIDRLADAIAEHADTRKLFFDTLRSAALEEA